MNDFDFLTGTWDVANRWRTDFAFSTDGGQTWVTNWYMDSTRRA